jgi:hypothetical protein
MNTTELSGDMGARSVRKPSTKHAASNRPLIIFNDDTCSLRYVDEPHTEDALTIRFVISRIPKWARSAG